MARTTEQVFDALRGILPDAFHGDGSILAGIAAVFAQVEDAIDDLYAHGLWGGAEGEWLDLHAAGWNVRRADEETDESLRSRLRDYPEQIVPSTVPAAVDPLIDEVDPLAADAVLLEHWKDGLFADSGYCDQDRPLETNAGFTVLVPDVYGVPTDERYAAMVWAVEGIRPHGARWFLVHDLEP